ncbi:MAG: PIN domain-containing protein [Candidatus Aenigmarchaeota archaeon]|nr:PIN domain-containing protein [Candidatus Aenigmarchaeota archaeon]
MFSDKDKFHDAGLSVYSAVLDKKIEAIAPALALPEICGVIRRSFGEQPAHMVEDKLLTLTENKLVEIKELTMERMKMSAETAIRFGIKGGDAVFVSLAEEFNAQLTTFDEELKKKIKDKVKLFKA